MGRSVVTKCKACSLVIENNHVEYWSGKRAKKDVLWGS